MESKSELFKIQIKIYSQKIFQKKFYFQNREINKFEINKNTRKILIKILSEKENLFYVKLSPIFVDKKKLLKTFTKKKNTDIISLLKTRISKTSENKFKIKIKKNLIKSQKKYFFNNIINKKKITNIVIKNKYMIRESLNVNKNFYYLKNEIRNYYYKLLIILKKNKKIKMSIISIWSKMVLAIIILKLFSESINIKKEILINNFETKNNYFQLWKNSKMTKKYLKKKKFKRSILIFYTISKLKSNHHFSNLKINIKQPIKKLFLKYYQIIKLKGLLKEYMKKSKLKRY